MNLILKIAGGLALALFLAAALAYIALAVDIGGVPRRHDVPFALSVYAGLGFLAAGFVAFIMGKKTVAIIGYLAPVLVCIGLIIYDSL